MDTVTFIYLFMLLPNICYGLGLKSLLKAEQKKNDLIWIMLYMFSTKTFSTLSFWIGPCLRYVITAFS